MSTDIQKQMRKKYEETSEGLKRHAKIMSWMVENAPDQWKHFRDLDEKCIAQMEAGRGSLVHFASLCARLEAACVAARTAVNKQYGLDEKARQGQSAASASKGVAVQGSPGHAKTDTELSPQATSLQE